MPQKILNLYVYRLRAGFTQEDLGARIGVPQETISYWENGLSIPYSYLVKLQEALSEVLPPGFSPTALGEPVGPQGEGD